MQRFAEAHLEPIRARDWLVTVLDVSTPEEFARGHPCQVAINIPLSELEASGTTAQETKSGGPYLGLYCVPAFEAVKRLRAEGYQARRLENGYLEWKNAGYPQSNLSNCFLP